MGSLRARCALCLPLRLANREGPGDRRAQSKHHVCPVRRLPLYRVLISGSRKMSDGMFLSACREVAKGFPNIKYDEDLLDRVCLQVGCCYESMSLESASRSRIRLCKTRNPTPTASWSCPIFTEISCQTCAPASLAVWA